MAASPSFDSDFDEQTRQALVRQLTNMLNQRQSDRQFFQENFKMFDEHFRRYGVLLEKILASLDNHNTIDTELREIKDLVNRVYHLGMWWDQQEQIHEGSQVAVNADDDDEFEF